MTVWRAPDQVFARLTGMWRIARRISNGARLDGTADFVIAEDGLAYHEQGQLVLADGASFQAERAYRFEARADGFDVFFAGRETYLFHAIALWREGDVLVGEAEHPCQADLYRTRYVFGPGDGFTITHTVQGPRHDYTMTTAYRR